MEKLNRLDEVPLADLSARQLSLLQETEVHLSEQEAEGEEVYLIAFRKDKKGT